MAKKIFEDELKVKKSFDYEQFSKKTFNRIELGNKSTFNFTGHLEYALRFLR